MAIETGPKPTPAHKVNGSADARQAKAKSIPDTPGADGVAPGFLAILSSLGDAPADAGVPDLTTEAAADAVVDPLTSTLIDPAALLAQTPTTPDAQNATSAALAAPATATAGKPAPGARPDAALAADAALAGVAESRTKGLQRAAGQVRSDKAAVAQEAQGTAIALTPEPKHDFKLFAAMEAQRNLQSAPEPEVVVASLSAKPEKSTAERSLFAKLSADTTYAGAASSFSTVEYASGAPVEVAPVLETQAAEQVKYWISQDVQNAELQLDGLGENPVEVTITMHGNEAHVAFRSDELQTHSLLEGAGSQLKEMLLREGLVLAGVSVGTSGTNDGKGGERKPRPGIKIAQVTPAQSPAPEAPRRMAGPAGRSVDLFV